MLKDYKKANKKESENIENVFLYGVQGGCSWDDLYKEFEKLNSLKIEEVNLDWLCCNNGLKYKISNISHVMNYDGVLKVK